MPKIGSYEYPVTKMSTLIKACESLVNTLKGQAEKEENLAKALGHETTKSGGFINKVSDLRKYGLMEKRGLIATKRARTIANPLTPKYREAALSEAVIELALWRDLRKRFGSTTPALEDFKIQLAELTGDTENSVKFGDTIRNLYIDAMSYYRNGAVETTDKKGDNIGEFEENEASTNKRSLPNNMILLKSGETEVKLERTKENIDIMISILTGMKSQNVDSNSEN